MEIVKTESLRKRFETASETVEVLKAIDLVLYSGTTTVVTGESGCGKTTLLNLIGGLDYPTGGNILVNGTDITSLSENDLSAYRSRFIGFIFQFHFLLKDFSALENVMIPSYLTGAAGGKERARRLLVDVGLEKRLHHFPSELSGGEKQRVAVARALMNEPSLILADEPTGNLDEKNTKIVEDLLFELVKSYGVTLLLASHSRETANRGDRCFELIHGELRE